MTKEKLLRFFDSVRQGETIRGINKNTRYTFAGIGAYDSHGKAPEFDGASVIILESERRKRKTIKLFVDVLVSFVTDGAGYLSYGRLPPLYLQEYRSRQGVSVPNLPDYVSHYKSLARYVYRNLKQ
jgi:hypothetical protein